MSSEASSKASSNTRKDSFWEYAVDLGKNKVKCNFCEHTFSGGVSRLKEHLAGQKGNVVSCSKVPDDVKAKAKGALGAIKATKDALLAKQQADRNEVIIGEEEAEMEQEYGEKHSFSSGVKTKGPMDKHLQPIKEQVDNKGKGVQTTLSIPWKKKAREDACEWIARFIFEAGISFNVVTQTCFAQMLEAVGKHGPGLKPPSAYEIAEKYLPKEVALKRTSLESFIETCKIHGCSLMTDCWTDRRGRSIMNLVLHCYAGTMFYDSENTSSDVHDGRYIYNLVNAAIEKLGEDTVVQVVTDNASNNLAAAKLLEIRRPSIFWTCCAAHTINLLLQDIGKIKPIRNAILNARTITVYLYAHTIVLDLMRDKIGGDLLRPGATRFATAFLSLQSLQEKKSKLKSLVNSAEWEDLKLSRTSSAKRVYNIVNNRTFWKNVQLALNVFEPLVKVLRRADSDSPSMGWLYGEMEMCKNEIALNLKHDERKVKPISLLIDKRWNDKLKSPLHMAGHLLNPFFYYQRRDAIEKESAFAEGFSDCVFKMYKDFDMQDKITSQLPLY